MMATSPAKTQAGLSKPATQLSSGRLSPLCATHWPENRHFSWPTCVKIVFRPEYGLFLWPEKINQPGFYVEPGFSVDFDLENLGKKRMV